MEKFPIYWNKPITFEGGAGYGYSRLIKDIDQFVVHDPSSRYALHCCPVLIFRPVPNKVNILFSMFESSDFAIGDPELVKVADHILVPSRFCLNVFRKYFDGPIYNVPLGADTDRFTYKKRKLKPGDVFRWLWVSSPDPRKMHTALGAEVWGTGFHRLKSTELYMKTSSSSGAHFLERKGNVIIDCRQVPDRELLEIYHSAHAYINLTLGEGFGLTSVEAMATGLPVLSITWSGVGEYLHDFSGYPIKYHTYRLDMENQNRVSSAEDKCYEQAIFDMEDTITKMGYVMANYDKALEKGRVAAKYVREKFKVSDFGDRLVSTLKEICQ